MSNYKYIQLLNSLSTDFYIALIDHIYDNCYDYALYDMDLIQAYLAK